MSVGEGLHESDHGSESASQRSLLVAVVAFCVSFALIMRTSEFTTILLSCVKLAQSFDLSRLDTPSFLRTQIELFQNLSAQNEFIQSLSTNMLTKGDWSSGLRPKGFSFGRFRMIFLVAATDISVIVPTWNEEGYLAKCLSSLRNQSLLKRRYEIIVVDGGSTDQTLEIARTFADKVLVEPGKPVGAARNAGANVAEGAILAFIDADTMASQAWLEGIIQSLRINPSAVGVTGPTIPYGGSSFDELMYRLANGLERFSFKLGFPHVAGFNSAYRKEAFWEAGGFDVNRELSEDVLLSLRIRHQGQILFSHDMVAYTSLRRINEYGYPYLTTYYMINVIMMLLFERNLSYPKVR